jgi:hypothetical protein
VGRQKELFKFFLTKIIFKKIIFNYIIDLLEWMHSKDSNK